MHFQNRHTQFMKTTVQAYGDLTKKYNYRGGLIYGRKYLFSKILINNTLRVKNTCFLFFETGIKNKLNIKKKKIAFNLT